jgi:hypothetical protein
MNETTVVLIARSGLQQEGDTHWFLACINFKEKRTEVYDSNGSGRHEQVHKTLLRYLNDEHQHEVSRLSVSLSLSLLSPFPQPPTLPFSFSIEWLGHQDKARECVVHVLLKVRMVRRLASAMC